MMDERLELLFEEALALPPEERDPFVQASCGGEAALRDELSSLLAAHEAAPDFLDRLASDVLPQAFRTLGSEHVPPGTTVGPYEIEGLLGAGGMGVVYLARDKTLQRRVALKFLPAHRAEDPAARERLLDEARAASALDHPHIAVIHQVGIAEPEHGGEMAGRPYIAMAYYEGDTLEERLAGGPVPPSRAVEWAAQITDGLQRAHEAGVVHRDIKAANILITRRDDVRILDFGIATRTDAEGAAAEASPVGTVAYMSPEQLRGEAVDHRTDLWSLGVLIHEMATGARPFPGASTPDVVGAILHADVELPRPGEPGVPPMLSRIVQRCLRKDPSQRYQSAGELLEDLRSVAPVGDPDAFRGDAGTGVPGPGSPAPRLRRPGVVVLPFVNISADTDNEYFSDGLTDEVIAQLAAIGGLRVISRTSAMRLKGTSLSLAEIARKLGVRYVLEGSVRKAGGMFRVTAQLVDAHTDDPLWTLARSGEEGDVFSVQEDVARGVVEALSVHLTPSETEALAARPIEDWRAYESYLRARYEAWRFTADGLERAQHYVESALEIVGENELLFTTLGLIAAMSIEAGVAGGPEALDRVEEYADRVFDIDPRSARGNWLRAFAAVNRGDVGRAIRAAERARHLSPEDPDILLLLGYVYARLDRTERADALIRQAAELDPLTPITQCMPGFVRLMEGRFDEAVEPYRRQVALDPHNPFAAVTLGWALAHAGRNEEAVAVLDDASSRFPETPFGSWAGSLACGLRGDADGAAGAVTPAFEAAAGGSEMFARALAECYALAGARDEALRWLERAVDLGLLSEAFIATHDGFLASLRDDPGFGVIVARVRSEAADVLEVLAEVAPEVGPEG